MLLLAARGIVALAAFLALGTPAIRAIEPDICQTAVDQWSCLMDKAKGSEADAQFSVATAYADDECVPRDDEKALQWMQREDYALFLKRQV